ncbi:hypothetical protein HHK36_000310 [Tetracentron sinense]|uniref:Uncharacterized protein n=1 Tax=Tetracentron sinense TaxID=13715 RepID=A0A835DPW3_TETSI|nr:hypothetical protein HHK36_000310 [Tetracentron sinense]
MDSSCKISAEEVISKLKDDGDFDRLRLKIIRKLKDNEDLRNSIISTVKQSAALNRAGAENLKPRQLSDAIHEEIGSKVMDQISDSLWEIIRSSDGMKSEITETVQSVYNKLVNPKGKEVDESSFPGEPMSVEKEAANNGVLAISACEMDYASSDSELKEPPGFSLCDHQQINNHPEEHKEELQMAMPHDPEAPEKEQREVPHYPQDVVQPSDVDLSVPPGFAAFVDGNQPCDGSDEDPDVPPGFG